jgi:hypothetical protein
MGHPNDNNLTRVRDDVSVTQQPMETDRLTTPATGSEALHPPRVDIVTVIAVAVVVYTLSSILHEALGHGLTCVLLGGKVTCIASTVCIPAGEPFGHTLAHYFLMQWWGTLGCAALTEYSRNAA